MSHKHTSIALLIVASAAAGTPGVACADVTVEQQTTFDLAFIKAHGTSTEYTTTDKQRRDSDLHCEGFMSMVCGNAQSGDIIRLDRDLTWELEPKKKEYREIPFPTAAQRQAAAQQAQETMQKLKQCPVAQQPTPAPDTSKCEMSAPRVDVKQTGTHATIAHHGENVLTACMMSFPEMSMFGEARLRKFAFEFVHYEEILANEEEEEEEPEQESNRDRVHV